MRFAIPRGTAPQVLDHAASANWCNEQLSSCDECDAIAARAQAEVGQPFIGPFHPAVAQVLAIAGQRDVETDGRGRGRGCGWATRCFCRCCSSRRNINQPEICALLINDLAIVQSERLYIVVSMRGMLLNV